MNLTDRRSIRKYTNQPVTDELLNSLFVKAFRSSNTGNMQTYSVVVTRDADIKKQLAPAHFNQPMIEQAPVVLTFCADFNRFSFWCKQRMAEPGYNNFESFIGAAIDATIVTQTFAVAAEAVGLGLCYLGTTTYNAAQIIEVLNLPRLVMPVTTLTIGYPAEMPLQNERLPLAGLVHKDRYRDYSKSDIDRIYKEKENLEENLKFVRENNKETLAQVFTDVRYTKANNIFFSKAYLEALKLQGFLD